MGRLARVVVPGHPHHVTQRRMCLDLACEQCRHREGEVLVWCLMTNYVHLVLVPPDEAAKAVLWRSLRTTRPAGDKDVVKRIEKLAGPPAGPSTGAGGF